MSSLNDLSYQKIKNYLDQWRYSSAWVKPPLKELLPWSEELFDEVTNRLLADEVSEAQVYRIVSWSYFLIFAFTDIPEKSPPDVLLPTNTYQIGEVIDFVLRFISRRVHIPFIYWSDIAPQLVSEIRRCYFQKKSANDFIFRDFDHEPTQKKQLELEARAETKAIYEEWSRDHMFS